MGRFSSCKHGDKIFHINGVYGYSLYSLFADPDWKWNTDKQLFNKWCNGETGYPFIDAAMIELKTTGFMSNRMRQNAASFLVKDLHIDWRWGAEWFESLLIDYDVALNWCNWNLIAGIGFTGNSKGYFNKDRQAGIHGAEGKLVKTWIPKLKCVSKRFIHKPYTMTEEQQQIYQCVVGKDYHVPCTLLKPPKRRKRVFYD